MDAWQPGLVFSTIICKVLLLMILTRDDNVLSSQHKSTTLKLCCIVQGIWILTLLTVIQVAVIQDDSLIKPSKATLLVIISFLQYLQLNITNVHNLFLSFGLLRVSLTDSMELYEAVATSYAEHIHLPALPHGLDALLHTAIESDGPLPVLAGRGPPQLSLL